MPDENVREMWSDERLDLALATLRSDVDKERPDLRRARADLVAAASAGRGDEPGPPPVPAPRRRWAMAAAAAAAVAAVVAGVLVAGSAARHDPGDRTGTAAATPTKAKSPLDRITATDEQLRPGQFRYVGEHQWWSTYGEGSTWKSEYRYETWIPPQERQLWMQRRETTGRSVLLSGDEDQARATGMGPPDATVEIYRAPCGDYFADGRKPCTYQPGWANPNEKFLASLPRDPGELLARVRAVSAGSRKMTPDALAVVVVSGLLHEWTAPADLRMALYRALAKLPTVKIIENVPDLEGRKGTAFTVSYGYARQEMIVDPRNGQLLGERGTQLTGDEGIKPGTVLADSAVHMAVVDGMGVRPAR